MSNRAKPVPLCSPGPLFVRSLRPQQVTMAVGESVVEQFGEETLAVVSTHSTIWLSREEGDGYRSEVGLLRPSDWLSSNGVFTEGARLELNLPEMGVTGEYQVMSIDPYEERSTAEDW